MDYISTKISRGVYGLKGGILLATGLSGIAGFTGCLTDFPPPLEDAGTVDTTDTSATGDPDADVSESSGTSTSVDEMPEGGVVSPVGPDQTDSGTDSDSTGDPSVSPTTSGDAYVPVECPPGSTECDGECVAGNSCCATSCEVSNATTECRDGQCVIVACAERFVDCDGAFDNGCEQDMAVEDAPVASVNEPFLVPRFDFDTDISEIDHRAWIGVPRFELASGCGTCETNEPPPDVPAITPSVNRGKVPGRSDLDANYALAWDETGLWVNLVVVDNELLSADDVPSADGDPRRYDNLMFVWEPSAGSSNPGTGDDHIAFIGIDERIVDWRDANTEGIAVSVKGTGQCRSIHAYFSRQYLFRSNGGAPSTFSPGDRHGVAIAYNDFDYEPGTAVAEREHVVFGVDMTFSSGTDYFQGERTLPQLQIEP